MMALCTAKITTHTHTHTYIQTLTSSYNSGVNQDSEINGQRQNNQQNTTWVQFQHLSRALLFTRHVKQATKPSVSLTVHLLHQVNLLPTM